MVRMSMPRSTSAMAMTGRIMGSEIEKKICRQRAPSSRAASSISLSWPCRAATKMMNRKGTHCQTSVTMSTLRASQVEPMKSMLRVNKADAHQQIADDAAVVEQQLPQEGHGGRHEQHRQQEQDAPALDQRIAIDERRKPQRDDELDGERDPADDQRVGEAVPEGVIVEEIDVLLEAHEIELEAAGIEAAPEREDAGIERDGEQIDDGGRHQKIGERLAHEGAAAARRRERNEERVRTASVMELLLKQCLLPRPEAGEEALRMLVDQNGSGLPLPIQRPGAVAAKFIGSLPW